MGAKEEELGIRVIFGYAGQLRPLQSIGGECTVCGKPVWIDLPKQFAVRSTDYEHYSCHNGRWLESRERSKRAWVTWDKKQIDQELRPWSTSNIIPVPVYRK